HREVELGPALVLRGADRRDGPCRRAGLRGVHRLGLRQAGRCADARAASRGPGRSAGGPRPSARMGLHGGARRHSRRERLLPDDAVLLLLRVHRTRTLDLGRLRTPGMRVVVLTTSYPRDARDISGHFVRDAVEGVRARGVEVDVVSPASFPHFGIAYGDGIAQNLRAAPWKVALVPAFLGAFAVAARRAARDADLA